MIPSCKVLKQQWHPMIQVGDDQDAISKISGCECNASICDKQLNSACSTLVVIPITLIMRGGKGLAPLSSFRMM